MVLLLILLGFMLICTSKIWAIWEPNPGISTVHESSEFRTRASSDFV